MAADGLAGLVRDAGRVGVAWAEPPAQRNGAGLRTEIRLLWPELAEALDALVLPEMSRELNEREP